MKSPHTIWKEGEAEFDETFIWKDNRLDAFANIVGLPRKDWRPTFALPEREFLDIKSHNKKQTILLLESQRDHWLEVTEGMKADTQTVLQKNETTGQMYVIEVPIPMREYNQAPSDLQEKIKTYYQEQIKLIKEDV